MLVMGSEVPALDEVVDQVSHCLSDKSHVDVVPRHPGNQVSVHLVCTGVSNATGVDTEIAIVSAWEEHALRISDREVGVVEPHVCKVHTSNIALASINDHQLLVVTPEDGEVPWVAKDLANVVRALTYTLGELEPYHHILM